MEKENLIDKAKKIGSIVGSMVHSFVQGIAREGAGLSLWLKSKITGREETFVPEAKIERWLLGEEAIKSKGPVDIAMDWTIRPTLRLGAKIGLIGAGREYKPDELGGIGRFLLGEEQLSPLEQEWQRYKEWGKQLFGDKYGETIGTLGFLGFTAMDFYVPFGEGRAGKIFLRKETLKELAKTTDKNAIKDILLREIPELHHSKVYKYVDDIAESLVKVNNPGMVRKTLQSRFDSIGKELGVDLAKIRKEVKEFKPGEYARELIEEGKSPSGSEELKEGVKPEKIAKTAKEGIKEPPIPPRPPKNPPLDDIPFRPEFNENGKKFRLRGFFKNLWENNPAFRERFQNHLDEFSVYYTPLKNKEVIERAVAEFMRYDTLEQAWKGFGFRLLRWLPADPARQAIEITKGILLSEAYWEAGNRVRAQQLMESVINLFGVTGYTLQFAKPVVKIFGTSPLFRSTWGANKFIDVVKEMAEKKNITLSEEFLKDIKEKVRNIFANVDDPKRQEEALRGLIDKRIAPQLPLTFREKLDIFRYGNMLSGPATHFRNAIFNAFQLINRNVFVLPTQAIIDWMRHHWNGAEREITFTDIKAGWKKTLGSTSLAFQTFWKTLKEGAEASGKFMDLAKRDPEIFETMINYSRYKKNVPNFLKIQQGVLNAMEASDKLFSTLIAAGEEARLRSMYERRGMKITSRVEKEIMERAQEVAEEYLVRRPLGAKREELSYASQILDALGERLMNTRDGLLNGKTKGERLLGYGLAMTVPFIRTPIDVGIAMLEHSPLGFARDNYTSEKLAQAILGTVAMGTAAIWAFNGRTTWLPPSDPKEKALFYEHRKPMSINIRGYDIPLLYFGPYGLAMAIPAAIQWALTEREPKWSGGWDETLSAIALSGARFLLSQTSLTGLMAWGKVLSGEEDYSFTGVLGGTLGQYIPLTSLLRTISKFVDPVYRKTGQDFWGPIKENLPWLRRTIQAYENVGGEADYNRWQVFAPYPGSRTSMPLSLALNELEIDRKRRKAWRLYAEDKMKLENIEKWVDWTRLGVGGKIKKFLTGEEPKEMEKVLTEKDIKEGMKIMKALKDYRFEDLYAKNAALRFAEIFLELLAKNDRDEEFKQIWEELPDDYKEKILKIRKERKEAEELPMSIPYGIEDLHIEERAKFLYKYFKDVIPKLSDEKIDLLVQILRERGILTDKVEEAFLNLHEKMKKEGAELTTSGTQQ